MTILVNSQDVITIFSFHFGHGGHFEIMQIRITCGFGYVLSSMEKNHLNMFAAILNSVILIWAVLRFFNNHKYIQIY